MADGVTVFVPIEVKSKLNQRVHHFVRAEIARRERGGAKIAVLSELNRLGSAHPFCAANTRIKITMTRVGRRELDSDNLAGALKSIRDGVADAIAIACGNDRNGRGNDNHKRFKWDTVQRKGATVGVEIRLEAMP